MLATLPEKQVAKILDAYTDDEAQALIYDWSFWARPKQLPPPGDWLGWLLLAGRGFGKTRAGGEWIVDRVRQGYKRIALVGQTKADVRDTMIEVEESSILQISPPWLMPIYEPSKRRLSWPQTGAVANIFSGDEPDQLRGPQFDTAWIDEPAKFRYPEETIHNLEFGLRLSVNPQFVATTTPRPIPIIKSWLADPRVVVTRGSTFENEANLAPTFIERMKTNYEGTRIGRQEIYAEILDDDPNALWTRDTLDKARVTQHPDLYKIVVAIDPPATTGTCGIVAAGVARIDGVQHGYTLGDDSTPEGASPNEWAMAAVAAYHRHNADELIYESNQGGDMVLHTLRNVQGGSNIPIRAVRATRGKHTRAQPVAALAEQQRYHHVGYFAELEDQLCGWVPGDTSPDRLDAMVWAAYGLGLIQSETLRILW